MESLGEGVYAYNLPENWTDANIMFTDGKAQMPSYAADLFMKQVPPCFAMTESGQS